MPNVTLTVTIDEGVLERVARSNLNAMKALAVAVLDAWCPRSFEIGDVVHHAFAGSDWLRCMEVLSVNRNGRGESQTTVIDFDGDIAIYPTKDLAHGERPDNQGEST